MGKQQRFRDIRGDAGDTSLLFKEEFKECQLCGGTGDGDPHRAHGEPDENCPLCLGSGEAINWDNANRMRNREMYLEKVEEVIDRMIKKNKACMMSSFWQDVQKLMEMFGN